MHTTPRRRFFLFTRRGLLVTLLWLATLAAAFLAGGLAYRHRTQIRALLGRGAESAVLQTSLHNVRVSELTVPADGRDGGIAPLGDRVLMASRTGRMWLVEGGSLTALELRVPLNTEEFDADPFNEGTINRELFGVKDLFVQERGDSIRILASHNHWLPDQDCYTVRVSGMVTTVGALTTGQTPGEWTTHFEATPCRPLTVRLSGERSPSLGAGGRMVAMGPDQILVTIGGLGPENDPVGSLMPQQADNSYGKTILLDLAAGTSRIYTIGHRNPQGLAIGADGQPWLTEHGARGGDELNRLVDGGNYGYPNVSYGTAYEAMTWPSNPVQGRHEGYDKPMFSWTPGIGISQAIVVRGNGFAHWAGDILVSSLGGGSLYRVRIEEDRAIFVEPIPIGHRVRDIIETADGSIVLKTDDNLLITLSSLEAAAEAGTLSGPERGAVLAATCQGCHTLTPGGANGIGPNLSGVVGRRIASVEGYAYTPALSALADRWTPENLRAFLAAPDSFAPGTAMQLTTRYDEAQLRDLVQYLETLR